MTRPSRPGDDPPEDPVRRSPYSRFGAPAPLIVAAGVILVQAIAAAALAIGQFFSVDASREAMGLTNGIFFAVYAVALGLVSLGMGRLKPWSRGPALMSQLLNLGLAWNYRHAPTTGLSAGVTLLALIALFGILHPHSIAALNRPEHRKQ